MGEIGTGSLVVRFLKRSLCIGNWISSSLAKSPMTARTCVSCFGASWTPGEIFFARGRNPDKHKRRQSVNN